MKLSLLAAAILLGAHAVPAPCSLDTTYCDQTASPADRAADLVRVYDHAPTEINMSITVSSSQH